MDKRKIKKIASLVTGASLIAGSASLFGCKEVESQKEEVEYITRLANELQLKFQFDVPENARFRDLVYIQTKRNDENILGITI